MFAQRTKNEPPFQRVQRPIQYLESFLGDSSGDYLYTGFSGEISDGGIFIHTFSTVPLYSPVTVTIHFPSGAQRPVRGVVEWLRAYNTAQPDQFPGFGIRFGVLDEQTRILLDEYLITHPPLFFDGADAPSAAHSPIVGNDIDRPSKQTVLGSSFEFDDDHHFVKGLTRDVKNYVARSSGQPWQVRVAPDLYKESYDGGFLDGDGPFRIFIPTSNPVPVGTRIALQVAALSGHHVGCMADVRWIRRPNPLVTSMSAPPGMGVTPTNLSQRAWRALGGETRMMICRPL